MAEGMLRDRDFVFLTYPNVKWYTEFDKQTGRMSEVKIDWFSISDGPTGIVYTQRYFPCWIVSLGAAAAFVTSIIGIAISWPHCNENRR